MLGILIRLRFRQLLAGMFKNSRNAKKPSAGKTILFAILFVYLIGVFLILFLMLFSQLCKPLAEAGILWFYYAIAVITSAALMLFMSIFAAKSQLYEAKDNELLFSMPLPPKFILLSRILFIYLTDLVFGAFVMLPATAVAFFFGYAPDIPGLVSLLLIFFTLPAAMTALSAFFGWILSLVASRVRSKTLFSTVFSIAFIAVYFYVYSRINNYINLLAQMGPELSGKIKTYAAPFYYAGTAIADGKPFPGLIFSAVCIIMFCLAVAILARGYVSVSLERHGAGAVKYQERELRAASPDAALLRRELKRFFTCSGYILNGAMGAILAVGFSAYVAVRHVAFTGILDEIGITNLVLPLLAVAIAAMLSTCLMSSSALSLEGKYLWIAKVSPVPAFSVLIAKARVQLVISLPAVLLSSTLCAVFFRGGAIDIFALFAFPVCAAWFFSLMGLCFNVLLPRFDWVSETAAVKSGMASFVAMTVGFFSLVAVAVPWIFLLRKYLTASLYLMLASVLFVLVSLLLRRWLKTSGSRRFEAL